MSFIKLSYRTLRDPRNFYKHLNRFRYENYALRTSKIEFTPPVFISLITDDCNLRCPTCYFLLQNKDIFMPRFISPLKFAEALELCDKNRTADVIFLSGGEALLHPQLDDLILICRRYNLKVKMSTNGILVSEKISLVSKLDYVNVSLDAHDYDSFKKYRGGSPAQFDAVVDGLKTLKAHGIPFSISFLLSSDNVKEVDKMLALAEKAIPNYVHFHNINPHDSEKFKPLLLHDEATQHFIRTIMKRTDYPFDIYMPVIFDARSDTFKYAKCIQPWYYFIFDSAGNIAYCCQTAASPNVGNLFKGHGFNSPFMQILRRDIMKSTVPPKKCLYCHRRFMGSEFGRFDSKKQIWHTQSPGSFFPF